MIKRLIVIHCPHSGQPARNGKCCYCGEIRVEEDEGILPIHECLDIDRMVDDGASYDDFTGGTLLNGVVLTMTPKTRWA